MSTLLLSLIFVNIVACEEYLIGLKTPRALRNVFNYKIGGTSVRDLIESKIHSQFSIGNFAAIYVDIPPILAEKLSDIPFISDIAANVRISLFSENFDFTNSIFEENYESDEDSDDDDDDEETDERYDGGIKTQTNAPRHLARISRRTQLPSSKPNDIGRFNYYYESEYQGQDVFVYVLDSGIDRQHPDFEGRVEAGIDTTGEGTGDFIGHGTHVAGLIGSKTFGVAKKVNLVEVKVLDSHGKGNVSDIIQGLEFVVKQCPRGKKKCIVNMSLGAPGTHRILDSAVSAVIQEGIPIVVAAGNSGLNACWYSPSKVKGAITVAAMDDRTDLMAPFSNWGQCVNVWAPGVNIKSLSNNGDGSLVLSGTSMASPIVAGVAAIYMSKGYEPDEIIKRLVSKSTKGIFKRRAIALRPRTPNKLIFYGTKSDDDIFDQATYPLIDETKFLDHLEGYTGYQKPIDFQ